jgi:hypothetical protein
LTSVSAAGNITGAYILGNGSQLTGLGATYSNADVAAYLPTYTGNLVSLQGAVTTTANITANYFVGNGATLSHITGANVSGTVGSASVAATVTTSAQPNITSVGTLSSLDVTGSLGASSLTIANSASIGGSLTMNSQKITNLASPTASTDAANKQYVDEVAEGLKAKPAARAATTTNLSAVYDNGNDGVGATLTADTNRVFTTLDGVTNWAITTPPQGVLVKNQTNPAYNGRYNLTSLGETGVSPWILTRCSLCDTAAEIPGAYTFVQFGTVNGGTGWVQTVADPETFVVGTDAILITQFSGAGTYSAGNGLDLTGTVFSLDDAFTVSGNISAGYFIGNGSQLTGLPGGYSDSNVAAYLPTYTGNLASLTGNIVTTGNITTGNILTDGYYYANGAPFAGGGGGGGGDVSKARLTGYSLVFGG